MIDLQRPRDVGELLAATFTTFGRRWHVFLTMMFVVVAPVIVLSDASAAAATSGADLTVVRGKVSMAVDYQGDPASCQAIAACATSGTLRFELTTPTTRDRGALFVALAGKHVVGSIFLIGRGRSSSTSLNGELACADGFDVGMYALGVSDVAGGLAFVPQGGSARKNSGEVTLGDDVLFATRCPAPLLGDFSSAFPVLVRSRRVLRQHRLTLRLAATNSFAGGGFTGSVHTDMEVVMRRTSNLSINKNGVDHIDVSLPAATSADRPELSSLGG